MKKVNIWKRFWNLYTGLNNLTKADFINIEACGDPIYNAETGKELSYNDIMNLYNNDEMISVYKDEYYDNIKLTIYANSGKYIMVVNRRFGELF